MPDVDTGKAFRLKVDPDHRYANLLVVAATDPKSNHTYEGVLATLRDEKIVHGVDKEKIGEAFETLQDMELGAVVRIAEATPATPPRDGQINFAVDVSGEATFDPANDDEEQIDFRSATSVVCVEPGALIATVIPPKQGSPGRTVTGAPIQPRKPEEAHIRPGQNAHYEPANHTFTATSQGRPVFSDFILSVLPVYEVEGDVDYGTGNINFRGSVVVHGSVLDDFQIIAKDILVFGTVGAADLQAEANIEVRGGINGRERATVRAGGEVMAKYISHANIECMSDLVVRREIVNSHVMCNGRVRVGNLIGGELTSRMGVEANILGSDLGVATRVEPGVDLEIRKVDDALDVVDRKIEALLSPYQAILGDRQKYKNMPKDRQEAFQRAYEGFERLRQAHMKLVERRQELVRDTAIEPLKEVLVYRTLHPDTIIRTDLCMRNFAKPQTGPIRVTEDIDRSTMVVDTYYGRQKTKD